MNKRKLIKHVEALRDKTLIEFKKELQENALHMEFRLLKSFISHMPKTYRKQNCNWVIVQSFLQYYTSEQGKHSSIEKCISLGIDPYGYTLDRLEAQGE